MEVWSCLNNFHNVDPIRNVDPTFPLLCSMQVMNQEGMDGLLNHFYSVVESKAVPLAKEKPKRISSIQNTARAGYESRQTFNMKNTVEEKSRALHLAMQLEAMAEGTREIECQCDVCASGRFQVPDHEDGPLGFLYGAGIEESNENFLKITSNFSMASLCYRNMLSGLDFSFPGVSFPFLYLGASHSAFAIHVEDYSLWSFNFLIKGYPKLWCVNEVNVYLHLYCHCSILISLC